ncbi:hypothetical protein ACFOJE_13615 [Azotobacter bryophylli]|uniref:SIR2-like domain-containing protein n=1 Tax=Azotobacter bryophylli TaxID=1986537 RepID=A0ABV7AV29_9GAMM
MRLGLFFGAGAEIGYGLPSGGKFAIDLFRQDPSGYKSELRRQLSSLDARSAYASNWLPQGYAEKSIYAFGRNEFTTLIESSVEYKRSEIINRLNAFDEECDRATQELGIDRAVLERKYNEISDSAFGERLYTHTIRLNEMLSRDVRLFGSEYYSAMLDLIRSEEQSDDLRRYVTSFLQLLVGAHGQALVQRLNQELFEEAPDDLPIFDDISGMFKLEFNRVGSTALELLLEENRSFDVGESASALSIFCAIAQKVLENIFTTVLDYQKLIDDHFRYLFSPDTEWAKFTRMVIFLKTARDYISSQAPDISDIPNSGYYHDLASLSCEINAIGTANYNSILSQVASSIGLSLPEVLHLNGSTSDYYNPYKNTVVTCASEDEVPQEQIHVPFILTQSGLKPLTSVAMSRRYVQLFDGYRESDAIVVVGFGFHKDDSHINGLFRELVESEEKPLYWISRSANGTSQEQQRRLMKKLRIGHEYRHLVRVVAVDAQTRISDGQLWINQVIADMNREI